MIQQQRRPRGRPLVVTSLGLAPVTVPRNYLGMHCNFPQLATGVSNPPPTFGFGTYRTQSAGIAWNHCNPSNGVYNWTLLDAVIDYHYSRGRDICFVFYGTPTWAASITGTNGPYGGNGEASPPSNNAFAGTFITALLTRYNGSGVKKIRYLELWNEPSYGVTASNLYYWGTAVQLVATSRVVFDAAKAVDPTITILSPGFDRVDPDNTVAAFLTAVDPVSAKTGLQLVEGVAFHAYYTTGFGPMSIVNGGTPYYVDMTRIRAAIVSAGGSVSMPLYCTEWGLSTAVGGTVLAQFAALSSSLRKARIGRTLLMAALQGCQFFGVYAFGAPLENLSGDLAEDYPGAIEALVDIHTRIAGKTLTAATIDQAGQISCLADGARFTI